MKKYLSLEWVYSIVAIQASPLMLVSLIIIPAISIHNRIRNTKLLVYAESVMGFFST
jgi:hypothetical protein